jgi:23S rRNA-intervening sequence protein
MGNFTELLVWKKSVDFAVQVYELTANFPKHETFGLRLQIRRAAASISNNLADDEATADGLQASIDEIARMLNGLIAYLTPSA